MAVSFASQRLELTDDSLEAWYELSEREHLGDGLPLIPPTLDRVEAMIAGSGRRPDELIAVLVPRLGAATVEKIAISAVMAGCRPEYMPVIIAAVEAIAHPDFELKISAVTTNACTPFMVINGPDRDTLGVNYRESCFGSGGRTNATIGRALRLIQINVGGAIPGLVSKSVFGQPGRYTMCIGENEEDNPWEPLHVQRGFRRDENTVTAFPVTGTHHLTDIYSMSGESYLHMVAHSVDAVAESIFGAANPVIIFCPQWAQRIAEDGFSRRDVQQYLWEKSQQPLERYPKDHQVVLHNTENRILPGDMVPLTDSPEKISILVAGGAGGLHTTTLPGFSGKPVTRTFELTKKS